MEIVIIGKLSVKYSVVRPIIEKMGGELVSHIHDKTAVIISTEKEIKKMNEKMQVAKTLGIQVVPESFLDEVQDGGAIEYIAKYSISDWGTDVRSSLLGLLLPDIIFLQPFKRINQKDDIPVRISGSLSTETAPIPQKVTLKVISKFATKCCIFRRQFQLSIFVFRWDGCRSEIKSCGHFSRLCRW